MTQMAFKLGDIATGARDVVRPCWPKETHASEGKADAHLRSQARRDGVDEATLNTYRCAHCAGGWHIGHRPMQKEESMPRRLRNLFVKSIALVKKPANKRTFLIVKSETGGNVKAKTYEQCLSEIQALRTPPPQPTLTKADVERFESLITDALRGVAFTKAAPKSAVDELEALVTARVQAHPAETRQVAVATIFQSRPELYDAVRQETTLTVHGNTLRDMYTRAEAGTPPLTKAESVDVEVERRLDGILAKESRLTRAQAMQFAFRQDPALYERWRTAYA